MEFLTEELKQTCFCNNVFVEFKEDSNHGQCIRDEAKIFRQGRRVDRGKIIYKDLIRFNMPTPPVWRKTNKRRYFEKDNLY